MTTTDTDAGPLAAAEKAKLRKVLGRWDLILFTACAIVSLDSVAATAQAGAQAITWLAISLVLFLIPYGMLTAELGSAFPVEGGPYEWTKLAFGRAAGAVTSVLYWLSNPIWVAGTLSATAIATINTFLLHRDMSTGAEIAVGLVFIWITTAVAIVSFRVGKWGPNLGTLVKIAVVLIFTILLVAFLANHGRPHGAAGVSDLKPSLNGLTTSMGVLVFLWVGFELSNGASEEMRNPRRDVPKMIVVAGGIAALLYGLVITGIVLIIPRSSLSSVSGFTAAYQAVSATFHSGALDTIFALLVIASLIGSGSVWLEGADRTQAVAALDGAAPAWMGRFTRFGTPIAVNLTSGVVSSVFCVLVFTLTSGSLASFFSVMLALTVSTATLTYLLVFPALIVLRRKYPNLPRPYRVPGGAAGAWTVVILTEVFLVFTGVTLLWPGAINAMFGQPYSIEDSYSVSRVFFESVTLGSFLAMVGLGLVFWRIGGRSRQAGTGVAAELSAAERAAGGGSETM